MSSIKFRSDNTELMQSLPEKIIQDLQQHELDSDLQLSAPVTETSEITRGDPITLTTIALTAVGAGGALSVLLSKDGFLSALARVLEKYVEGRKVEVLIETDDGITVTNYDEFFQIWQYQQRNINVMSMHMC